MLMMGTAIMVFGAVVLAIGGLLHVGLMPPDALGRTPTYVIIAGCAVLVLGAAEKWLPTREQVRRTLRRWGGA